MSDLTFVTPAYNAQDTITSTLLSAQACAPAEVIVVDDGSIDQTGHVATALGARTIRQDNAGPAAARRTGLAQVNTEFVLLLDADDQVIPEGVAAALDLLRANPDAAVVVSQTMTKGRRGDLYPLPVWGEGIDPASLIARGHAPAPPASIIFRTEKLRAAFADADPGVWPKLAEDYELLIRVAFQGTVLYNPVAAATYQWIGGRSGAGLLQEIHDSRVIQRHYAERAGVPLGSLETPSRRADYASIALRRASEAAPQLWHPVRLGWTAVGAALAPERVVRALKRTRA